MRYLIVGIILIISGIFLISRVIAQESVNLTTPISKTSTSSCALDSLLLDITGKRIVASLTCNNGDQLTKQYDAFTNPTGSSLLSTLNVSTNTAGNSLIKKVYARLIADGVIIGSVTGVAQ